VTTLLDGNVLVALVVEDHVHHEAVRDWFDPEVPFATCPITQGALLRLLIRFGASGLDAATVLAGLTGQRRHQFWPDGIGYDRVRADKLLGHRQVTDAYLAELARSHQGRLATVDRGLAGLHADVAELIPTGPR
jgi:toxin-antitoxin system PIN domain toxin